MDELVRGLSKSQQAELAEDHGSNPSTGPTMGDVVAQRYNRRDLLKGLLAALAPGLQRAQVAGPGGEGGVGLLGSGAGVERGQGLVLQRCLAGQEQALRAGVGALAGKGAALPSAQLQRRRGRQGLYA